MTDLLRDTLKGMDGKLRALTDVRLIGALERFVWENDAAAFQGESVQLACSRASGARATFPSPVTV